MTVRPRDSWTIIKATPTDGCRTPMPIGVPADATPRPRDCQRIPSLLGAEGGASTRFICLLPLVLFEFVFDTKLSDHLRRRKIELLFETRFFVRLDHLFD